MNEDAAGRVNIGFIAAIVAAATIGGFMFGYDSGVINGTQDGLEGAFGVSALGTGVLVGALLIGCAVGAFTAGRLADRIGRRGVMMLAAILFIVSAIGAGAAGSAEMFVIARFIGGLGVGAASVTAPVYISEVTPAAIRGRLSTVQQIMIITGLTGAFVANYALARSAGGSTAEFWLGYQAWRWMLWLQVAPATIYLLALLVIPESPRYLMLKGREGEAHAVLARLFGGAAADAKVAEIRGTLAGDHHASAATTPDAPPAEAPAAASPAQQAADATTNPAGAGENPQLRGSEHAPEPATASAPAENDSVTTLSPAVRRAVLEYHVDPSKIRGTGKDGRLTKDDVVAAAQAQTAGGPVHEPEARTPSSPAQAGAQAPEAKAPAASPPAPAQSKAWTPAFAGERKEERVKMTRLRQTIATRLKEAQNTAALLTTFNDVDMSAVIDARAKYKDLFEKKHGIRLGFMGFFVKAVALAAKDIPSVNAKIEGDEIVYHDYLDVSVAVSAPKGLVVPVVRNADRMSFAEIEKTIADFGKRAKEGTLTVDDMSGGTFTISNGGVFGSLLSTPIINPPQSAVLGMHRIEERPVVRDGQVVARPMMYLALSYDHRLVDGREAVTFLVRVKEAIEDPTRLLIDL